MKVLVLILVILVSGDMAVASHCYHLDKAKLKGPFNPIEFFGDKKLKIKSHLRLIEEGLFEGKKQVCKWSLNGGSGTKEKFSLDGNIAVPILDPQCEKPFSHAETGHGFGDWEFMLCGALFEDRLRVTHGNQTLFVSLKSLKQWSRFYPEKIDPTKFGD